MPIHQLSTDIMPLFACFVIFTSYFNFVLKSKLGITCRKMLLWCSVIVRSHVGLLMYGKNVYVNARECVTCTSRCFNHTVTCPVLTVTWTVDGFSRSLDSHSMRSEWKTTENRLTNALRDCRVHNLQLKLRSDCHRSGESKSSRRALLIV